MAGQLPLAGIQVIEVCNVAAGPYCGMLLADMGADVIKVENPEGGDTLRSWPPLSDGYSENFAALNRNKRSVTLNLKEPVDLAMLRALAQGAQVLIENNRPGVMERLGVGYAALAQVNPRLVYCSISAYGRSGQVRRSFGRFRRRPVRGVLHRLCAARHGPDRARRAPGRADARRHAGHRSAADFGVFRQRPRPARARLCPSAQCAVPGVS